MKIRDRIIIVILSTIFILTLFVKTEKLMKADSLIQRIKNKYQTRRKI